MLAVYQDPQAIGERPDTWCNLVSPETLDPHSHISLSHKVVYHLLTVLSSMIHAWYVLIILVIHPSHDVVQTTIAQLLLVFTKMKTLHINGGILHLEYIGW